ncbi:MAG: DUF3291 domain-containing protein [Thermoleophilia bacterium]
MNVARLRAPLEAPQLREFVAALAPVNALADAAHGFVWRLQDEGGDATAVPVLGDPRLIVNLSVWESLDVLRAFVYNGHHLELMRRRRDWFARMEEAYQVLWWVPTGHRPTVAEAEHRLGLLRAGGSTPEAFTFARPFGPDGMDWSPPEQETRSGRIPGVV